MKTIASEWESFRAASIPVRASEQQVRDQRRTFYAGMVSAFALMNQTSGMEDDRAVNYLTRLYDELSRFDVALARDEA